MKKPTIQEKHHLDNYYKGLRGRTKTIIMRILIVILIGLLLLLQYDLWVGEGSLVMVWQLEKSLEKQKTQNNKLKDRNSALAGEVSDLKKGNQAIEERARSELGMIKEDETFFQIVKDKKQ